MKKVTLTLALVALLAFGGQAFGELCTIDQVPAATLLIPYFAVDVSDGACDDPTSLTTVFTVSNASAAPTVAHVTVWTDWTVPALDFDIYLTGFDVQTVNAKDWFCSGNLPQTGSAVSNQGAFSLPNTAPPSCNNTATPGAGPNYANPAIIEAFRDHLTNWFTGNQSAVTGDCAGSGQEGDTAVGYITIDTVADCNLLFPSSATYWGGGIATLDNQLWGEYFYVDQANDFAQALPAVHIEADASLTTGADATFYGRYSAGLDGREPLPTTFAARYATGGAFDGTNFNVWREGSAAAAAVGCGGAPSWYPIDLSNTTGNGAIIAFDEEENPVIVTSGPSGFPSEEITIPNETQSLAVGSELSVGSFSFGWVYMNLQNSRAVAPSPGQAWVSQIWSNSGRFSGGWDATQLDSGCSPTVTNP